MRNDSLQRICQGVAVVCTHDAKITINEMNARAIALEDLPWHSVFWDKVRIFNLK